MKSSVDGRRAVMEEGGEGVRKSTTQKREHCLLEWGVVTDDVETPQRHAKVQRIFSSAVLHI